MTKKNAKKMATRARKAVRGGPYMDNMRHVEREDAENADEGPDAILAAVMRFSPATLEEVQAAVAAAIRQGVNPEAGWRITDGFPGGAIYEAIRQSEHERPHRSYPSMIPGIGTPLFDTRGARSLACRCFECRDDDDACLRVLRKAVRDRASHFYALETAALAGLIARLGTIDEVVGVPEALVSAAEQKDMLLDRLHDHVAISELWPDRTAFHDWISRLVEAVSRRIPSDQLWWQYNRRILELRDGRF